MREPDLSFSWESLGIRCIFSPREKSNLLHKLETLGRASVPEWKARIHPQALHRFLVSICKAPCRSDVWCLYYNLSQWRALSSPLSETIGGESRTARSLSFIESLPSPSVTNPHCRKHRSQFSSVVQSCPTLWDPMNLSMPGLPVHHQLLEFTQTQVHQVGDAIQPSHPLLSPSPAPITPRIRVFSNESALCMRWPKYWISALASVLLKNTQDWSPLERIVWISLQSKGLSRVFSNTTVQKRQFFGAQPSSQSNSHFHAWLLEKPQID